MENSHWQLADTSRPKSLKLVRELGLYPQSDRKPFMVVQWGWEQWWWQ